MNLEYSWSRYRFFLVIGLAVSSGPLLFGNEESIPLDAPPVERNDIPTATLTSPQIMNLENETPLMGIDPKPLAKFWQDWNLVTVRFRTSPAEQRFVYANDIAWEALKKGAKNFPEGSMLGKIAFMVGFDPRFPSSYEPNEFSRIQIMKKDSKAYKDSNGWGYAIYIGAAPATKRSFGKEEMMACHACHNLVKDRDFVFSTALFNDAPKKQRKPFSLLNAFQLTEKTKLSHRPKEILKELPQFNFNKIQQYSMPSFVGTINESENTLGRLAASNDYPLLLWSTNNKAFVFAIKEQVAGSGCKSSAKLWAKSVPTQKDENNKLIDTPVREMLFCDGVLK
jgi:hypothetical protein